MKKILLLGLLAGCDGADELAECQTRGSAAFDAYRMMSQERDSSRDAYHEMAKKLQEAEAKLEDLGCSKDEECFVTRKIKKVKRATYSIETYSIPASPILRYDGHCRNELGAIVPC